MRLNKQFYLPILITLLTVTGPIQAVTAAEVMTADNVKTDKKLRLPNAGRSDLQELIQRVASGDTGDGQPTEPEPDEIETPEVAEPEQPKVAADPQVEQPTVAKADSKPASSAKAPRGITTNTNGTSTWTFDSDTGLLVFGAGQLAQRIDTNIKAAGLVETQVKSIQFESNVIAPVSVTYLFANLGQLSEFIDLQNFDTSNVTSMSYWFYNSKGLTNPDLSVLNTSNVTNMSNMFYGSGVTSLDLSSWNVDKVTTFNYMFYNDTALSTLNLSSWGAHRTATSVDMSSMFYGTSALTNLNLTNFKTTNVTSMSSMFYQASALTILDLSDWDVTKVVGFDNMFYQATKLASLNLTNWGVGRTSPSVSMMSMFRGTSALTNLNLTNFKTTNVTGMSYMFHQASALAKLDLSGWDVTKVTNFSHMFYQATKLTSLNLTNWGISRTATSVDMSHMFDGTSALTNLNLTNFKTINVTSMAFTFQGVGLTNLDLSDWDVTKVANFSGTFNGASKLTTLNLSGWGTNRTALTVAMSYMFAYTEALRTLILTDFKTTNVTNMSYMFQYTGLTALDLSNWDVDKITTFTYMFDNAKQLANLNITGWHIGKNAANINLSYMFANTQTLKTLVISATNFANSNGMFYASGIESIDLSNWYPSLSTVCAFMFENANKLWQIKLGEGATFSLNPKISEAPQVGTTITDNGQTYKTTTASWQEVGTGTVHNPKGKLVSTDDMYSESATRPVTYVWAQSPTFDGVTNLTFGTLGVGAFRNGNKPLAINMVTGSVNLINLDASKSYKVYVAQKSDWTTAGQSANISKNDLSIQYGQSSLNSSVGFWAGTSANSQKNIFFNHNSTDSFSIWLNPNAVIDTKLLGKQLESELTWTLNETP